MPRQARYPRTGEAWAKCSWCGQDYPASQVWLNPRFGWQCFKCWDGLIQRDQYVQPIFPYEGTRRTPAPLTNTLDEGAGDVDSSSVWGVYTLSDRADPTTIYDVDFTVSPFSFTTPSTSGNPAVTGIRIPNEWIVYILGGFLQVSQGSIFDIPGTTNWAGSGSLWVDTDGFLQFAPYVQQMVVGI